MRRGWLAAPYLVGLTALLVVPAGAAIWLATTQFYGFEPPRFVGLDNLRRMAGDARFWDSLGVSVVIAVIVVPVRIALATACALLLHRRRRGAGLGRVAAYLPSVAPDAAWALLWLWLLNPLYGPISLAGQALGLGRLPFLTDSAVTVLGVALLLALQLGEAFVVALAARGTIPVSRYEMATLEGAGPVFALRHVTAPAMTGLLVLLAVRDLVVLVQTTFVPVLLVTEGGPGTATTTSALYIYERAFVYGDLGYASALSASVLGLTAIVVAVVVCLAWRRRPFAAA